MAKSMTKSQIADYLAGKAGITKKGAVQILDDLAALAYREAKNVFTVPGSTFSVDAIITGNTMNGTLAVPSGGVNTTGTLNLTKR